MLYFDNDNLVSFPNCGFVDLAEGGRRKRFLLEAGEYIFHLLAKFTLNHVSYLLVLCDWSILCHRLKHFEVLIGDETLELAEKLADFNVGTSVFAKTAIHTSCSPVVCL